MQGLRRRIVHLRIRSPLGYLLSCEFRELGLFERKKIAHSTWAIIFTLVFLTCPLAAQESSLITGEPPPVIDLSLAKIRGTVRDAITKQPLEGFSVSVISSSPIQIAQTAVTGSDGHFEVSGLPTGKYRLAAGGLATGYERASRSVQIEITERETFDLDLVPAKVITGSVIAENGEPVSRALVLARTEGFVRGRLRIIESRHSFTSADGSFTLANITASIPYTIRVLPQKAQIEVFPDRSEQQADRWVERAPSQILAPMYYLNTADRTSATPVVAGSSSIATGLVMQVEESAGYCLRGDFSRATTVAEPKPIALLLVESDVQSQYIVASGPVPYDHTFQICGLPQGKYSLLAFDSSSPNEPMYATAEILVSNRHIDLAVLALQPRFRLNGRVQCLPNECSPDDLKDILVEIYPKGRLSVGDETGSLLSADGSFGLSNLIGGYYMLDISRLPKGIYVDSVYLDSEAIWGRPFLATTSGTIKVTLGQEGPILSGTVRDRDSKGVKGLTVVLVPSSFPEFKPGQILATSTDDRGEFAFSGFSPGRYLLYTDHSGDRVRALLLERIKARLQTGRVEAISLRRRESKQVELRADP